MCSFVSRIIPIEFLSIVSCTRQLGAPSNSARHGAPSNSASLGFTRYMRIDREEEKSATIQGGPLSA